MSINPFLGKIKKHVHACPCDIIVFLFSLLSSLPPSLPTLLSLSHHPYICKLDISKLIYCCDFIDFISEQHGESKTK